MTREEACDLAGDQELLFADGFDEALVGVVRVFSRTVALYDLEACLACLVAEGESYEDAVGHMDYNVLGSYVGDMTPAFAIFPARLRARRRKRPCERKQKR